MSIKWTISNMERVLNDGFVIVAYWECVASQDGMSARVYGSQSFTYLPDEENFIPYTELTEADVLEWVHMSMGAEQVAAYEASATSALDDILTPRTSYGTPWGEAPE